MSEFKLQSPPRHKVHLYVNPYTHDYEITDIPTKYQVQHIDSKLKSPNQIAFQFSSHFWFHNASIYWTTLFLCQSRSILPKPIKGTSARYSVLFTMKAFKFIRGLFGKKEKKDRREEEMRKEKMRTEREKQLFDLIEEMEEDFRWFEERSRRKAMNRRKKMEMEEERKRRKFYALCEFFERRGYEFFTRTPMVKMGDLYPDLKDFIPPTENRSWQKKMAQLYPSLQW